MALSILEVALSDTALAALMASPTAALEAANVINALVRKGKISKIVIQRQQFERYLNEGLSPKLALEFAKK